MPQETGADEVEKTSAGYSCYTVKELAASKYVHTDPLATPIEECFDWAHELHDLVAFQGSSEFYLVVFRSVRKSTADSVMLYEADAAAQEEARLSGGLLKYWYGIMNERRECLAMCIWTSREDAKKAIYKPAHRVAMKLASSMYDMYRLERYSLQIDENMVPTFTLLGRCMSS
ncbi:UPF0643 protein PB2B2.08 [Physcomitrium patens]|uniref:ABM domain-containing protein n=1 Tax=Physcomitrium patens TaxID=3218 RepID=A0A2K1JVU7_PHYPA|nr:UPF0643 protein PB2B2.08-like [Physcomitrium patens]XP_024388286.1 UPF0643 protein PB2B2.08-like [Physcomitrium patens]PNR45647.1 hypothetical protein PHYPA_015418 [Physcomitrium patens]|eukprot:XP_024388284.1 UPF0643 protein PB2B2.08-like [Physcomitrella patens]